MLGLTLYDPFRASLSTRDFDRWFFGPFRFSRFDGGACFPKVDVSESEDGYTVTAEFPGYSKEEVKVEVEEGVLRLSAEHKEEKEEEKDGYRLKERYHGSFRRTFGLPENVDGDHVEASMDKGVLTIHLQKKEPEKPRKIEVQVH